jgi:hypothetical protein
LIPAFNQAPRSLKTVTTPVLPAWSIRLNGTYFSRKQEIHNHKMPQLKEALLLFVLPALCPLTKG